MILFPRGAQDGQFSRPRRCRVCLNGEAGWFPVGIDLFPYTEAELERLKSEHPSWYAAITSGIDLPIRP